MVAKLGLFLKFIGEISNDSYWSNIHGVSMSQECQEPLVEADDSLWISLVNFCLEESNKVYYSYIKNIK